jgi:uncharacterized protein (TIGR03435 family)
MKIRLLLLMLPATAFAQTPPSFEVASVKASDPNARSNTYGFDRTGVNIRNGTLKGVIEMAYDLRDFQILGGPSWIETDRYDILTKLSPDDAKALPSDFLARVEQLRIRLRPVLTERFQLKTHFETREQPEYSLVVGKNGSKMKEDGDLSRPGGGISSNCTVMKGDRARMANLSQVLSRQLQRPVLDNTKLTGFYDFEMTYVPENGCLDPGSDSALALPSLFTALQEQLGLRLESIKAQWR